MKSNLFSWAVALSCVAGAFAAEATNGAEATSAPRHIKIVLVGDSTVNDQGGWGYGFKQFLTNAECINTAMNGRSTMTFLREGRWTNALALRGDYYFIQFGHNNEPGHTNRSTDMPTFISDMKKYVDDTRAIGARPILVTPLCRRQWDKNNPGKIKSSLAPYAEEDRKIAAEKNVPLVDLHARSKEYYEKVGKAECEKFSPVKTVDGRNSFDGTHLKGEGRVLMARLVEDEVRKQVPELVPYLLAEPNPALVAPESAEKKKGQVQPAEVKSR